MVCKQIILKLVCMRFVLFFVLISLYACKQDHSIVLVKTIDSETGQPIPNIKIYVYRGEDELVVGEALTDSQGLGLLDFKYDKGNKYSVVVFNSDTYWGNDRATDLVKGNNEVTFEMSPYSFLKLNLKSSNPLDKGLKIEIENELEGFITSKRFYNHSNTLDTLFLYKLRQKAGQKIIKCTVDSSWIIKQTLSIPVQLTGNDTAYAIINF